MTSEIEWLTSADGTKGHTWNALVGCTPVSDGCMRCYAAAIAARTMTPAHEGVTINKKRRNASGKLVNLAVFNGRVNLQPDRLRLPLRLKKPRRIFVNSMSDLFHEEVTFDFIAATYGVMAAASQHTYLILTKRPERAIEFFTWLAHACYLDGLDERSCCLRHAGLPMFNGPLWPLPQVQLGVSAETQRHWDERTTLLRRCPAAVHWVSVEPQLGPVVGGDALSWLSWVVVGGESGPGARPFDVQWAASLVRECKNADTPVFIKQLGSRPLASGRRVVLGDKSGSDMNEWTGELAPLAVRELVPCSRASDSPCGRA